jgi:predicted Rossmann fold nucleotide-binding protein DprA/Smf involved in DNA uptake
MNAVKLLIAGSRSIEQFDLSDYISPQTDLIISGGAKGIDTLAEQYADQHKISKLIMRPRYDLYGKAAPIIRNHEMVEMADVVLIVWDGKSKGTKSTELYARKMQKRVIVVVCE